MELNYNYKTDNLEIIMPIIIKNSKFYYNTINYLNYIINNDKINQLKINLYEIEKAKNYEIFGVYKDIIYECENNRFSHKSVLISCIYDTIKNLKSDSNCNCIYYEYDENKIKSKYFKVALHINYIIFKIDNSIHINKYILFPKHINKIIIYNPYIGIFHYVNNIYEYYYPGNNFDKFLEYEIINKKNYNKCFEWGGIYLSFIEDNLNKKYFELIRNCDENILKGNYKTKINLKLKPLLYLMFMNNNINSCIVFIQTINDINYYKNKNLKLHKLVSNNYIYNELKNVFGYEIIKILSENLNKYGLFDNEYKFNPIYEVINYKINSKDYIKYIADLKYILNFINEMDENIKLKTTKIFDYLDVDLYNKNHYKMINFIIDNFSTQYIINSNNIKKDLIYIKENEKDENINYELLIILEKLYKIFL